MSLRKNMNFSEAKMPSGLKGLIITDMRHMNFEFDFTLNTLNLHFNVFIEEY